MISSNCKNAPGILVVSPKDTCKTSIIIGLPIGISSFCYLIICGFAGYLRNITLRPSLIKDWLFFLITILVVNSVMYSSLVLFFSVNLDYNDILVNLLFTFLFYVIFANIFEIYLKLVFGKSNV